MRRTTNSGTTTVCAACSDQNLLVRLSALSTITLVREPSLFHLDYTSRANQQRHSRPHYADTTSPMRLSPAYAAKTPTPAS